MSNKLKNTEDVKRCIICERIANCYHYGVLSCEACKIFFRRYHSTPVIECPTKNCVIDQSFTSCRYCRLQKCFNAGMSIDKIKPVDKTNNKRRVNKKLESIKKQCKQVNPKERNFISSYSTSAAFHSYESRQCSTKITVSSDELNRPSTSNHQIFNINIRNSDEISEKNLTGVTKILSQDMNERHDQDQLNINSFDLDNVTNEHETELNKNITELNSLCSPREMNDTLVHKYFMECLSTAVTKAYSIIYFHTNEQIVEMKNNPFRRERIQQFMSFSKAYRWRKFSTKFSKIIVKMKEFVENIPVFTELSPEDQNILFKTGCFEMSFLHIIRYFDISLNQIMVGKVFIPKEIFLAKGTFK